VITEEDGRIVRFLEKPTWGEVFSDTINTGILHRRARSARPHPPEEELGLQQEPSFPPCWPGAIAWSDTSRRCTGRTWEISDEYLNVHLDLLAGKVQDRLRRGEGGGADVWIGEGRRSTTRRSCPIVPLGKKCAVGSGVTMEQRRDRPTDASSRTGGHSVRAVSAGSALSVERGPGSSENIVGSDVQVGRATFLAGEGR